MKAIKQLIKKIYLELINTGERPIVETMFEDVHHNVQHSYAFAAKFARGKSILDFGCGGGYGTEYLSRFTDKNVTGFDIDKKTIGINKKFFNKNNLIFSDVKNIGCYDMVISCQVIEHLKDTQKFLDDVSKQYLKPRGIFICATPNKLVTSPGLKKPIMVFHLKEFTPLDLKQELEKYFKNVTIFGQSDKTLEELKKINNDTEKISYRFKILRTISQIEIIRMINRHLLMFIKYLFMGWLPDYRKIDCALIEDKQCIDKCATLIAQCEN